TKSALLALVPPQRSGCVTAVINLKALFLPERGFLCVAADAGWMHCPPAAQFAAGISGYLLSKQQAQAQHKEKK
ncbi:MAG: hypothetical protein M3Y54_04520, partial [Bacteroidota bacterium]|nr:hypothetical protein [Bacteroidota bacterium]